MIVGMIQLMAVRFGMSVTQISVLGHVKNPTAAAGRRGVEQSVWRRRSPAALSAIHNCSCGRSDLKLSNRLRKRPLEEKKQSKTRIRHSLVLFRQNIVNFLLPAEFNSINLLF
jgi:hypothetical protein